MRMMSKKIIAFVMLWVLLLTGCQHALAKDEYTVQNVCGYSDGLYIIQLQKKGEDISGNPNGYNGCMDRQGNIVFVLPKGYWFAGLRWDRYLADNGGEYFYNGTAVICKLRSEDTPYYSSYSGDYVFGLVSSTGKILSKPQWDDVGMFVDGIAQIGKNGQYGYINAKGKVILPCEWRKTEPFSEGMGLVVNDENLGGFVNTDGKLVIPCKWSGAGSFAGGTAAVRNSKGKWGLINQKGKQVLACKYDVIEKMSEGLSCVADGGLTNCGYINAKGKLVIKQNKRFTSAGMFHNGLARVRLNGTNTKTPEEGYINTKGKVIYSAKGIYATDFQGEYAIVYKRGANGLQDSYTYGAVNTKGEVVMPIKKRNCALAAFPAPGTTELAITMNDRMQYGLMNLKGKTVLDCQWLSIGTFLNGRAVVVNQQYLFGVINTKGKLVIPCEWDAILPSADGKLFMVRNYNGCGVLTADGKTLIEPMYGYAFAGPDRIALMDGDGARFTDLSGNPLATGE